MGENYIVINGKRAELTEEQLEKLGIIVSNNKRWRAEVGGRYYRLNSFGEIYHSLDYRTPNDDYLYYSHNYFKTREDAEKYARVLKTEMLLRQYADEHNEDMVWDGRCRHYFLYFNDSINTVNTDYYTVSTDYYTFSKEARKIYFSSREIAKAAIGEIGKEYIKEYLTYEW